MKNIFIVPRSNKINNPYLRQYLLNKEAREVGFLGFVFSRNIDVHWIDEVVSSRRYIKLIMICLFVVYSSLLGGSANIYIHNSAPRWRGVISYFFMKIMLKSNLNKIFLDDKIRAVATRYYRVSINNSHLEAHPFLFNGFDGFKKYAGDQFSKYGDYLVIFGRVHSCKKIPESVKFVLNHTCFNVLLVGSGSEIESKRYNTQRVFFIDKNLSDKDLALAVLSSSGVVINARNYTTTGQFSFAANFNTKFYVGKKVLLPYSGNNYKGYDIERFK
jgi:hypothetical protein